MICRRRGGLSKAGGKGGTGQGSAEGRPPPTRQDAGGNSGQGVDKQPLRRLHTGKEVSSCPVPPGGNWCRTGAVLAPHRGGAVWQLGEMGGEVQGRKREGSSVGKVVGRREQEQ